MKIIIITQNDFQTIPKNIRLILKENSVTLDHIFIIDSKGSLTNKLDLFLNFGLIQLIKLAFYTLKSLILSVLSIASDKFDYYESFFSLKLKYPRLKIHKVTDIHSKENIELISNLAPDLIVSFSCPVKLKKNILSIPKKG